MSWAGTMSEATVSVITSLYNGDKYIKGFLDDLVRQTYFDSCQIIIVDANSPGDEYEVVRKYIKNHKNIVYHRLASDPGIYGAWNYAINNSDSKYITNANLDDRRAPNQVQRLVEVLEQNADIDLAYSQCFITDVSNETFQNNSSGYKVYPTSEFCKEGMVKCLPGCQPVWRRSMHTKAGLFNEAYKYAGDWEMWLRAVRMGSKFKMLDGVYGLYYNNPTGLSTDIKKHTEKFLEERKIFWEYTDVFGIQTTNIYRDYFSRCL